MNHTKTILSAITLCIAINTFAAESVATKKRKQPSSPAAAPVESIADQMQTIRHALETTAPQDLHPGKSTIFLIHGGKVKDVVGIDAHRQAYSHTASQSRRVHDYNEWQAEKEKAYKAHRAEQLKLAASKRASAQPFFQPIYPIKAEAPSVQDAFGQARAAIENLAQERVAQAKKLKTQASAPQNDEADKVSEVIVVE